MFSTLCCALLMKPPRQPVHYLYPCRLQELIHDWLRGDVSESLTGNYRVLRMPGVN